MKVVRASDNLFHRAEQRRTQLTTPRGGKITLFQTDDPDYMLVSRIHVHAPNQSKGIGSELLDMAKAHATQSGRGLILTPAADEPEDQERLLDFYRHRGFDGPDEEGQMRWRGNHD